MIIAVTEKWSLRPACGEFMEITTQDDKEVSACIIDARHVRSSSTDAFHYVL